MKRVLLKKKIEKKICRSRTREKFEVHKQQLIEAQEKLSSLKKDAGLYEPQVNVPNTQSAHKTVDEERDEREKKRLSDEFTAASE